jgi:uncharacterized protein YwgA
MITERLRNQMDSKQAMEIVESESNNICRTIYQMQTEASKHSDTLDAITICNIIQQCERWENTVTALKFALGCMEKERIRTALQFDDMYYKEE